MLHPLVFFFAILFLAVYVYHRNHPMTESMADFQIEPIQRELRLRKKNKLNPHDALCDLYSSKPGSVQNPPALLDHEKGVWIDSPELKNKIKAIRKSATDKGVWQSNKINTYINSTVTPFDTTMLKYEEPLSLNTTQEDIVNPNVTHFDFNTFLPTNPSAYSNVNGPVEYTSFFTKAPKTQYIYDKKYGYRTYK
jgi:hypothetical protein